MAVVVANAVAGADGAIINDIGFDFDALANLGVSSDAFQVVAATSNAVRLTGGTEAATGTTDGTGTTETLAPDAGDEAGAEAAGSGYDIVVSGQFAFTNGGGADGAVEGITGLDQISGDSRIQSIHVARDGQHLVTVAGLDLAYSELLTWLGGSADDGGVDATGSVDAPDGFEALGDDVDLGILADAGDESVLTESGGEGAAGEEDQSAPDSPLAAVLADSDLISGTEQSDTLRGFDGADVVEGHGGDDNLDGGSGFDMLVLEGARADWTFEPGAVATGDADAAGEGFAGSEGGDVWLATNATTGEVDTITDFELVSFADGAFVIEDLTGGTGTGTADDGTGTVATGTSVEINAATEVGLAPDSGLDFA